MKRKILFTEKVFLTFMWLILLIMLFHDWIDLGPFNDLEGIRARNTTEELILITGINVASIGIILLLAHLFAGKTYPLWVKLWLVIHPSCVFAGALSAWWIPYFFGTDADMVERYEIMFGDTHSFLPERNGITVNTIHVLFHSMLLFCIFLAFFISFVQKRKMEKDQKKKIDFY